MFVHVRKKPIESLVKRMERMEQISNTRDRGRPKLGGRHFAVICMDYKGFKKDKIVDRND